MQYKKIEQEYIKIKKMFYSMEGFDDDTSDNMAHSDVDNAIKDSIADGTYFLPSNLGDLVYSNKPVNDPLVGRILSEIHKKIPFLYADGVRDLDIREWWNISGFERRIMQNDDFAARLSMMLYYSDKNIGNGLSTEDAIRKVSKVFVIYGDNSLNFGDPNRALPYELKNRLMTHDEKLRHSEISLNTVAIDYSTFNAYIRHQIRMGKV